jgi:GNAT superfamily N-acetyltransferase
MSATAYDIVRYTPKYRNQILSLQQRLWGRDLRAISEYFEWKHERNPYGNEPLVYLALCGDAVVGMRGFLRGEWQVGSTKQRVSAVTAGDTAVQAAHESRGIFRRIMRFAMTDLKQRGFTCMLNLGASPATYFRSLRDGWVAIQAFDPVRTETGIWQKVDQLHHKIVGIPGLWRMEDNDLLYRLVRRKRRHPKSRVPLSVSSSARPLEMAEFILSGAPDKRITQRRDARYLKWRFADPFASFHFLYWDDGDLKGFLVLEQRRHRSFGHVKIADWQAADEVIRRALLECAIEFANPAAISIWTGSRSESEIRLLGEAAFRRFDDSRGIKRYKPSLLLRTLDADTLPDDRGDDVSLTDGSAWNVRMLFCD